MRVGTPSASIETFESKVSFRPHGNGYWQGYFPIGNKKLCHRLVYSGNIVNILGWSTSIEEQACEAQGSRRFSGKLDWFECQTRFFRRGNYSSELLFSSELVQSKESDIDKGNELHPNRTWTLSSFASLTWNYLLASPFGCGLFSLSNRF